MPLLFQTTTKFVDDKFDGKRTYFRCWLLDNGEGNREVIKPFVFIKGDNLHILWNPDMAFVQCGDSLVTGVRVCAYETIKVVLPSHCHNVFCGTVLMIFEPQYLGPIFPASLIQGIKIPKHSLLHSVDCIVIANKTNSLGTMSLQVQSGLAACG